MIWSSCWQQTVSLWTDSLHTFCKTKINCACSRQRLVSLEGHFWLQDFYDSTEQEHKVALVFFFSFILETFLIIQVSVSTLTHWENKWKINLLASYQDSSFQWKSLWGSSSRSDTWCQKRQLQSEVHDCTLILKTNERTHHEGCLCCLLSDSKTSFYLPNKNLIEVIGLIMEM